MKNLISLFILLPLFLVSKSQNYIPMIEDSMIVINSINYPSNKVYRKYKYIGDTLINNIAYFKCYLDSNIKDSSFLVTPEMSYYGAIRETDKKVYFLKSGNSIEKKIYDFKVNLLDTTDIYFKSNSFDSTYKTYFYHVENPLSFLSRKGYFYRTTDPRLPILAVAEGFGNITEHINEIEQDYPTKRTCVIKKNNSSSNIPSNYSQCYQNIINSYISLYENSLVQNITIYPNPTHSRIKINSPDLKIKSFILLNLEGKEITRFNQTSTSQEIDISYLVNGIYLLKIKLENGESITKKIIKQ